MQKQIPRSARNDKKLRKGMEFGHSGRTESRQRARAGVPGRVVVQILRLVRLITPASKGRSPGTPMITPASKDRSLGTPMAPDFAQDDRRKTSKSKSNSRFLAPLGMTKK